MANDYYNWTGDFVPGAKVRSDEVDTELTALEAAFDLLPSPDKLAAGSQIGATDSGVADAYVASNGGSSTLVDLQMLVFIPDNTNTGASTVALNGGTARAVVRNDGSAVQAGDLIAGIPVVMVYDLANTRWALVGATAEQCNQSFRPGVNDQTGTTYTLATTDEAKMVICTNASAITVTVPSDSTADLPIGFICHVHQGGAGQVTLSPDTGVTLDYATSLKTRTQYAALSVMKTASNTFKVVGDQAST